LSGARRAIHAFLFGRGPIAFVLVLAIAVGFAASALGRTPSANDNAKSAEGWAWSRIKQGLPADFGDHCGGPLDPTKKDDPAWLDPKLCRTITAGFLVDILTRSPRRDEATYAGVEIQNAKIVGDVDLSFAKLDRPIQITNSRFEGSISLSYVRAESLVDLGGSLIAGPLDMSSFHSESDVGLFGVAMKADVNLD